MDTIASAMSPSWFSGTTLRVCAALLVVALVGCMAPDPLTATLERRLDGDRTGACVAAAVIDGAGPADPGKVRRAVVCADAKHPRPIDFRTAFEIGSVSKTMTGMLLADLIAAGKLSLQDPLARHVPAGISVPSWQGQPIRLAHLTTHTSGLPSLPSRMPGTNPEDPYADLTEEALFASLGDVTLTAAPGSQFAYSNFAVMVLSAVLARAAGQDFETLLRQRLFAPLGMTRAFVATRPAGVVVAPGHLPGGQPASPWNFPVNLAGVGGVRASLLDMVRYAQAALGHGNRETVARIFDSQQAVAATAPGVEMGMGWGRVSLGDRVLLTHEGGTGGFSANISVDAKARRAVVLLSDTSLTNLGGLEGLAVHLLGLTPFLEGPRVVATPPADLLAALAGRYFIEDYQLGARLFVRDGKLFIHADGQDAFELGFDSHGDFFPLAFDALLTPVRTPEGMTFTWTQGGGTVKARRQ